MTEIEHLIARALPDASLYEGGEAAMLPALIRWLVSTGRLRARTQVAYEVPWLGRRVDLALLTSRGQASAFELKIGRLQRALEQAAYNRSSFHASWIVTPNQPKADGLQWAHHLRVGVLVVRGESVSVAAPSPRTAPNDQAARRLRGAIVRRATFE